MIQRRDGPRLPLEPFGELLVRDLDRNDAVQAGIARLPDLSHSSRPDEPEDFVWTQV